MVLEWVTLVFSIVGTVLTGFVGVFSFFWIRPAERKLRKLEADLSLQNARHEEIQRVLIDSRTEYSKESHRKTCDSCTLVYKAFLKIHSSSGVLSLCESLHNLPAIKSHAKNATSLAQFAKWMETFIPPDWQKSNVFQEANEVEPFVPERIWELYKLAETLLGTVQIQIREMRTDFNGTLIDQKKIQSKIVKIFPEERTALEKWGTSCYRKIMERCKYDIICEIRKTFGLDPVTSTFLRIVDAEAVSVLAHSKREIPKEFQASVRLDSID